MEPVELAQEPNANLRHGRTALRLLTFPALLLYLEGALRLYMGMRLDYLPVILPFALSAGFLLAGLTAVLPRLRPRLAQAMEKRETPLALRLALRFRFPPSV